MSLTTLLNKQTKIVGPQTYIYLFLDQLPQTYIWNTQSRLTWFFTIKNHNAILLCQVKRKSIRQDWWYERSTFDFKRNSCGPFGWYERKGKVKESSFSGTIQAFDLQESVSITFLQLSHGKTFPAKRILQISQDFEGKSRETRAIIYTKIMHTYKITKWFTPGC